MKKIIILFVMAFTLVFGAANCKKAEEMKADAINKAKQEATEMAKKEGADLAKKAIEEACKKEKDPKKCVEDKLKAAITK